MSVELRLLSGVVLRGQEITAPRLHGLLALLATDLRAGASAARLIEGLWPEDLPDNPGKALQVLVSRARSRFGADLITSTPSGYRLALRPEQVDAAALEACAAAAERHARAGDHAAALDRASAGLALWDGKVEEASDPVSALRLARRPAFRTLVAVRAVTLARLGRYAEALGPLTEVAAEQPRDEDVLAELLRAEAATVGPSAALARYDAYRRGLRDELGTDPGPALRAVHGQLLRAAEPVVRRGVLHDPNPLLGREEDIAAVTGLLRTARVVSVIGAGGLGKTRLAHAVGRLAGHRSVHLVALAGCPENGDVATEVAAAVGAGGTPAGGPVAGIVQQLGAGPALLILDNCEQVLGPVAALVGALVAMSPELRVLVTSRAPLGLAAETVYPLPTLRPATAAELFAQRARSVRPDVELPAGEVAALCAQLDGLPLAIELAAARVRVMSVAEVSARLVDRFAVLRGRSRDAPHRHQTLYAVVDWSWNLLDERGREAVRLLSVFPGGFTASAAHRLLGGDPDEALEVVEQLVEQSLLQVTEAGSGTRFRMLETVRDFGAVRRREAGADEHALAGFLGWARDFGLANNSDFTVTDDGTAPAGNLRAEQDNLVRALRHGLDRGDGPTVAAVWATLGPWWYIGSSYARIAEVAGECARVLSHYRPAPEYVDVTRTAATVCALSAFTQGARELRSLIVLRRLPAAPPDTLVRAIAAVFRAAPGQEGQLRPLDGDPPLLAGVAHTVASLRSEHAGDRAEALAAACRMLGAFERAPNLWMRYQAHCRIGRLALLAERGELARTHLERALRQIERLESRPDRDDLIVGLVMAALQRGDVDGAQDWLARVPDQADPFAQPAKLVVDAEIRLARGEVDDGLRRWRELTGLMTGTANPFYRPDPRGVQVWTLEGRSATVLAHAYQGRLDLVSDLLAELPGQVAALLGSPAPQTAGHLVELTACGAVLLALGVADIGSGRPAAGARLVALAERFDPPHQIHPTMSSARARRAAEEADPAAYAGAVSAHAGLDVPGLRAAALAALGDREPSVG
ncbi:BTAD domain-containing putative transcriptional regulator [Longispora sp. K20-0274]|uniref:ATP-binding protein n=1 Tax=Longispora sp. K20-0274 TaxID=3088255 RepID=UPI00399AD887